MSKYEPLRRYLASQGGRETPMTFMEIENVLGFRLPESARVHRPWWSNNVGTHVNAAAWRNAGWRTSKVDLGAERVTFVREPTVQSGVAESSTAWRPQDAAIRIPLAALSKTALRLVDDAAEELDGDRAQAIAAILDSYALERRRQLLDSFSGGPRSGFDSVAAIREDRDGR